MATTKRLALFSTTSRHRHQRPSKLYYTNHQDDDEDQPVKVKQWKKSIRGKEVVFDVDEDESLPKPIGHVVRVSRKRHEFHYTAFHLDGRSYYLDDSVLVVPDDIKKKPMVAIIKDITEYGDGSMKITGQWLCHPEEVETRGVGSGLSHDGRELFYTFHYEMVEAESVMHRCVVHFVPSNKQLPNRKTNPGFFVQKLYDTKQGKLFDLTDKNLKGYSKRMLRKVYGENEAKTELNPSLKAESTGSSTGAASAYHTILEKFKALTGEAKTELNPSSLKAESTGSSTGTASAYHTILEKFKALTGEIKRDKFLKRLLEGIKFVWKSIENGQKFDNEKDGSDNFGHASDNNISSNATRSHDKLSKTTSFLWPDAAVPAVTALEKAVHNALGSDFKKYNQQMWQLVFNLQNSALLARRLITEEIEPSEILKMSLNELTISEARCRRCREKNVGLTDIIQVGSTCRFKLECDACGYTSYVSRDELRLRRMDAPSMSTTRFRE